MIPNCDSCHQPMKLVKQGKSTKGKYQHRIRRFHCDLCDITTTIHADGQRDLVFEPLETAMESGNINNSEEQQDLFEYLFKKLHRSN